MLAETDLKELVGFGSWTTRDLSILASLHLTEAESKVGHYRSINCIFADVFVTAERTMDAEALGVKDAFKPISLGDMTEGAVFHLALVAMATQRHFRQVILV